MTPRPVPSVAPPDSAATDAPTLNALYRVALGQLREGGCATARAGLLRYLAANSHAADAPQALLYVRESFAAQGQATAADSVYKLLPARYPASDEAATALYKHGRILCDRGERTAALDALRKVVADYPRSTAASLARDSGGVCER